ncbi:Gfo/Idh/MocA family oxidoreductase [Myxococcaceae bacterium GXIMD 01537]
MPNTIRWGILGTGWVAGLFAEGLRALPDARLQAVGSRTRRNAEAFARAHGAARAHGSYEALVADDEVDVVYVASPHAAHAAHCLLALAAGKPVLCEKPFTLDAAEARAVIAAARKRGVFCMEGMWMRFTPVFQEMEARVRAGAIGDVRMLTAHLGFPVEFSAGHRLFDPALGGGALLDLGVYPLSLAVRLLGRPTRVASHAVFNPTGVDEQVTMLLDFPGARQATVTTSLCNRAPNDAAIQGTEGTIHLHEPLYCPETLSLVRTHRQVGGGGGGLASRLGLGWLQQHPLMKGVRDAVRFARTERVTRRVLGNGYAHEAAEVHRCLREGLRESPLMPLDESLAVMETVDAVRQAWGRPAHQSQSGG